MIKKWVGLTAETVIQMRQSRVDEETIITRIMPFVAQGLQMKNTDFQIGNYTLLTLLASNRTLTDEVVNASMEAICQGWTDDSRRYAILCLITLAQHREGDNILPDTVLHSLLSIR